MKLFKIGEQLYKQDGQKLVEIETPENIEELQVFDYSKEAETFEKMSIKDVAETFEKRRATANELKDKAQEGTEEDVSKFFEAADEVIALAHIHDQRKKVTEQANIELPEIETAESGDDAAKTEKDLTKAENDEQEKADQDTETSEETSETQEEEKKDNAFRPQIKPELEGTEANKELIMAADTIIRQANGGYGIKPDNTLTVASESQKRMGFRPAEGNTSYGTDEFYNDFAEKAAPIWETAEEYRNQNSEFAGSPQFVKIGSFDTMEKSGRSSDKIYAADVTTSCDEGTILPFVECDVEARDLTSLIDWVSVGKQCKVQYYQDFSIDETQYIGRWDKTAQDAFNTARDAYYTALGVTPWDAAAQAAAETARIDMLNAQKNIIGQPESCRPVSAPIALETLYARMAWPIDFEDCSPDMIRFTQEKLDRKFMRATNSWLLEKLYDASYEVTFDHTDAATYPRLSKLDAALAVEIVFTELVAKSKVIKNTSDSVWTAFVPEPMIDLLSTGLKISAFETRRELESFTGFNIVPVIDPKGSTVNGTTDELFQSFGDLSTPAIGSSNAFSTQRLLRNWDVQLFDLSDVIGVTRPTIDLKAQVTHDSINGNWVAASMYETFRGLGFPSCVPGIYVKFSNLCASGMKAGFSDTSCSVS